MKAQLRLFILLCIASIQLLGCGGSASSSSGFTPPGSSTAPPNAVTPPTTSAAVPLSLNIFTVYDTTQFADNQTFVETGTTTCQVTPTAPVATCTLRIPEGRLHYSSMHFQYSWFTSSCKLLIFQPYFYRASTAAIYVPPGSPPGATGIDCSGSVSAPASTCWGGAAPQLVPTFPIDSALIELPNEALSAGIAQNKAVTLSSSYSLGVGTPVDPAATTYHGSNRLTTNDLNPADYGTAYSIAQLGNIGDAYLANSYVNYTFTCRDDWFDPQTYVIHLNITDVNTNGDPPGTGLNDFVTWDELP
jgi:hypothetical protein